MVTIRKRTWTTKRLGTACVLLWLAMMGATLWPFDPHPRNRVEWIEQSNGVHFSKAGVIVGNSAFPVKEAQSEQECSLEIWLSADGLSDRDTILTFYAGEPPPHFLLRQYQSAVVISYESRTARGGGPKGRANTELYVGDVFKNGRATLLTVTSGVKGINIFVDGVVRRTVPDDELSVRAFSGKLIVGTSPWTYGRWAGRLYGLAVYASELDAAQVHEHYDEWTRHGEIAGATPDAAVARFMFDEQQGSVIHDRIPGAPDLSIPAYFQLPEKAMLAAPFKEVMPLWVRIDDIARNILGFVPFGMLVYLYLMRVRGDFSAALLTIFIGGTTSLFIEFLQAFIPRRDSDVTDIITNTLGTMVGVLLLQLPPIKAMLKNLGMLSTRSDGRAAEG